MTCFVAIPRLTGATAAWQLSTKALKERSMDEKNPADPADEEILMELGAVSEETKGMIGGMWETDISLDLKLQ